MNRKLVSVLLALTMCVGLAIPAFAEPAEEVPAPEESEVLTAEESHEHEAEEVSHIGTDDDCTFVVYFTCWLDDTESTDVATLEANIHNCEWEGNKINDFIGYLYEKIDDDQHNVYSKYNVRCKICGKTTILCEWNGTANHSWIRGSFVGYQSSGAAGHKAIYNNSCSACNATKTDGNLESHSMQKMGYTGNNYHQGTKHYFQYNYACTQCGYTKALYESYSCPGPTGGGCIMPDTPINKLEPPVEELDMTETEDVTAPEETTEPEDVAEPEEVTEPEESAIPEETGIPEEVNAPEVTDIPEEVETPAETVEPEETIVPEEAVISEDPTGPGETVVPDDGESVE